MTHHPNHPQHHQQQHHQQPSKGLHKDWRAWTAIILMLGAMAIYVMTMDESVGPDGQPQQAMDAAADAE
jgi:hypothetical protein